MKKTLTILAGLILSISTAFSQAPAASFTYSPSCILTGEPVEFTNTSTNYILDLWNFGDPASLLNDTSTLTNPTHVFSTAGSYTVTLIVTNGTVFDTTTEVINVVSIAFVQITSSHTGAICSGTSVTFTAVAQNAGVNPIYQWYNDGVEVGTNSTTYTSTALTNQDSVWVVVSDTSSCSTTITSVSNTIVVTVNSTPVAAITPATDTICSGSSTTLTASGGTTYVWSTGARTAAVTVTPEATTTYTVIASTGTGCSATASAVVTTKPAPDVTITPAGAITICDGQSETLTANGGGTYAWSTGSDSASITVTPTASSTYSVTVTGMNGCSAAATKAITVRANPVAGITPATSTICLGQSATLTATGAGGAFGGAGYVWSTGATTAAITVTPTVTTIYTVTATNFAGCSASVSRTVTVDSLPVVSIVPSTDTICNGQTTTLIGLGGGNYAWSNGGNTQAIIVTPDSTTNYTLRVTNSNGCTASGAVNVVVKSNPVVVISPGNTAICIGNSVTLTASGGATYAWSTGSDTSSITVNPTSTTTYDVTVIGANGCSATDSIIVISDTTLKPVIAPVNAQACLGIPITLTVTAGATYTWSTGATSQGISVSPGTNTSYSVTVNNGIGCSGTATIDVTVNSNPTISVSANPPSVCLGGSTTITATGGSSYSWNNGGDSASITVSPATATTYTVTVTGTGGCTATANISVAVNENPTATITPATITMCSGTDTTLTAHGGTSYVWSNGNDSAAITISPSATSIYTVTVTSASGCTASASRTVTVNPSPDASISPVTDTVCSGTAVTLTASGSTAAFGGYRWSNGGFGATITVTPTTTTTYTVTVSNGFGPGACSATASAEVVIVPGPPIAISPLTVAICSGQSTTLSASGGVSYTWSNGSTTSSITVSPVATTTYTVTASGTGECSTTASRIVTVHPSPTATITPATSSICIGQSVTLTAHGVVAGGTYTWSTGSTAATVTVGPVVTTTYYVTVTTAAGCSASANAVVIADSSLTPVITPSNPTLCSGTAVTLTVTAGTAYTWSNGSTHEAITVTPAASTAYTVTVTNGAGCSGTASVNVTVVTGVTPAISPATVSICTGGSATLTASGGTSYAWSTGFDSASITVTPAATTTYTVTVTNGGSCSATASRVVTVNAPPTVTITPAESDICTGGTATLTARSFGAAVTYSWSTGASAAAITVNPVTTTTYTVTVTTTAGCSASASRTVTVSAPPTATISPSADTLCSGQSATLTASGGGGFAAYIWSTGAREATVTVTPAVTTTYNVTVTSGTGCSAVASSTVLVNVTPVVSVSPSTDTICSGVAVNLTASGGASYAWSNSANTSIIAVEPATTTTYTVTVTGSDNCSATAASTITVNVVNAAIVPSVASICTGQTDTLVANGTGTYFWSTGSTSSSIAITPSATTIYSLTVTGNNNCSASASATVNVNTNLVPVISPDSANICLGSAISLTVSEGTTYAWSNNSTAQSILVAPAATTTYTVTVSNGIGCSGTASVQVNVSGNPTATISPATETICRGQSASLTASGGSAYEWSNNENTAIITVSPAATTLYTVTVTNAGGCSATASRTVTVNPLPVATITPGASTICTGASATLTAHGGTGYLWNNAATTVAITVSPASTTSYSVTVSNGDGCTAAASVTVTVNTATVSIAPATDTTCGGTNTTLTASGAEFYRWSTGSFAAAITVAPTVTTTYTVTATAAGGCTATASRIVNVIPATASISPASDSVCSGVSTTLTASSGSAYTWSAGPHSQSITVNPVATTTYRVTVTNSTGCSATASRTVVVKTNPAVSVDPVNDTVCGGVNVDITAIGTGTYAWSTSATTQIIAVAPASTTNYTVTLTGTNGCTASATSTVTVKPVNAAINPSISSLCSGQSETLTASGGGTYVWNNNSTAASMDVSPTSTTNYSVTVTGTNNCSASATATVNVNGSLTPVITPTTPSVCPGGSVTLIVTAGTTYVWSTNATSQSITVSPSTETTYSVTVTNGGSCSGTASVNVTINSVPVVQISPPTDTICIGQSATLTGSGGTKYTWSNSETTAAITVFPAIPTTYSVTVTSVNNCSASGSATVTVMNNPAPAVDPSSTSICSGESASLIASGGSSYTWSNGVTSTNIIVSPSTTTTYTVTVSNGGSCSATASGLVIVNANPSAAITASPDSICSGQSSLLTASGGNSYAWNTGSNTDTTTLSPLATTIYRVTVTDASGCTASASAEVVVNTPPSASVSPDTASICLGGTATLTAYGGTGYIWSNTNSTPIINVNPTVSTNYSVTVTAANGCSASATGVVIVNNIPSVFINPPSASVCQGSSITLTALGASSYAWSNTATTDSITISPSSTTAYSVTGTDANNCSASVSENVVVNSVPVASVLPATDTICSGSTATFTASGGGNYLWSDGATTAAIHVSPTNTTVYTVTVTDLVTGCSASAASTLTVNTVNAAVNPALSSICSNQSQTITASGGVSYSWSNSSTTASITVTPSSTTTYDVTITGANLCAVSLSATVDVNQFLVPVITPANPVICAGDTVSLSVTAGTTYHWSDDATTEGITVIPGSSTSYTVTVSSTVGCSGTASTNVTVNSRPVAAINPSSSSICTGQNDTLTASGGPSYLWSNASTSAVLIVSPGANTSYAITITNSNNCSSTASASVTVNSLPVAAVSPATDTICSGVSVTLTASGGSSYRWSNAVSAASNAVSPQATSSYFVTVTNAAGCSATSSATITVYQSPVAEINPDSSSICIGQSTVLTAYDTTGLGNLTYSWSDGTSGNTDSITPASNTNYIVTITYNQCSSTATATVAVNSNPVAAILPSPASVCIGQSTTVTASGGTGGYVWSTGDSTATISVNPTVNSTYTVTVINSSGCADTASVLVIVYGLPTATVIPDSAVICSGQSATFSASGGVGYTWSNSQSTSTITVSPSSTTTYVVTVSDINGCTASAIGVAAVNIPAQPSISPANDTICAGVNVTLTASGSSSYVWNNGSQAASISVSPTSSTTYTVTATDLNECTAVASAYVMVKSSPDAVINPAVSSICSGQSTGLTASGGVSYAWSNSSTAAAITVTPSSTTTYTVTVTGSNDCSASASAVVDVNASLIPVITPASDSVCLGSTATLQVTSGVSYSWSNGATTQSIDVSPSSTTSYSVTVSNGTECNGTASVNVTVNSNPSVFFSPASSFTICNGEDVNVTASGGSSYAWSNGTDLASVTLQPALTTTYVVTVTGANGCTATGSAVVTVNQPTSSYDSVNICFGHTYTFNGQTFTVTGLYVDTLSNSNGCDSFAKLNLVVTPLLVNNENITVCNGTSYPFNGREITQSGTYTDTLISSQGCDSLVILNLTFAPTVSSSMNASICAGGSYSFGGNEITAAGTYYDTLIASGGCDSVVTLNLTIGQFITGSVSAGICPGSSYNFYGKIISDTGTYNDTVSNISGCDSLITLTLSALIPPTINWNVSDTLCTNGDTVVTLPAASPSGGVYSGTGVSGTSIDINRAGSPPYTITYTVVGGNGCSDSLSNHFIPELCTGISELTAEHAIRLYPNPAIGVLMVESDLFTAGSPVPIIYDVTGNMVEVGYSREANKFTFNTSTLAPGVYFMTCNEQGTTVTVKFVKLD